MLLLFLALIPSSLGEVFVISRRPASSAAMCNSAGWSDNDRNGILNTHNEMRSKIARGVYSARGTRKPAAKDMLKMVYDCGLEASAQDWANKCPTGHSGVKGNGENLYWTYSTADLNIAGQGATASRDWENEFQSIGWPSNKLTTGLFNSGIGHATQMAWASTGKVGCGVKKCPSSRAGFKNEIVVVCQYNPQGNILNQNIYSEGTTCSACPKGTSCERSTGLCR